MTLAASLMTVVQMNDLNNSVWLWVTLDNLVYLWLTVRAI